MSKDRATYMVSAHVVPLKGTVIDWVIQQCAPRFGTIGIQWSDNLEVRSGTNNRGSFEGSRELSWVSWNVVRAFASSRFSIKRVH